MITSLLLRDSQPAPEDRPASALRRIALVGGPNVGKSCLFTALTGRYVMVSNYPGTTVEVSRARIVFAGGTAEVVDTLASSSSAPSARRSELRSGFS